MKIPYQDFENCAMYMSRLFKNAMEVAVPRKQSNATKSFVGNPAIKIFETSLDKMFLQICT